MQFYVTKYQAARGVHYKEVEKKALITFKDIKSRTKRTPYVKSKYFKSEKIFLNLFWSHLYQKHEKDRTRRLRFYDCAIDLIRNTALAPESRENFKQKDELLHRFYGRTKLNEKFIVQIKENKRTHRKDLISIYPL